MIDEMMRGPASSDTGRSALAATVLVGEVCGERAVYGAISPHSQTASIKWLAGGIA